MYREAISYDDILLVPRFSSLMSRSETDPRSGEYDLPICTSPMDLITTPEMIKYFIENRLMCCAHRYFKSPQEQIELVKSANLSQHEFQKVWFCVGSIKKYKEWINYLFENGVKRFLIDLAHGDCQLCIDTIKYIKQLGHKIGKNNDLTAPRVIAGNVATKSGFSRLQDAGADGIRCGIGGGSICATRTATAFGVPTLTTIMDCVKVKNDNVMLIADGGIKTAGDIAKAMAAGADICMIGKLLAGTHLAGGICFNKNKEISIDPVDIMWKEYYGMASRKAREGVLNYGSVEGVNGLVKYSGSTDLLINDIKLNLQASLSYAGVTNWKNFRKKVKIIRITNGSWIESQTHVE